MRVWVYPEREWQELGARRIEASWEEVRPEANGKDELDHDADIIHRYAAFNPSEKEKAIAYARKLVDGYKTAYGQVTLQEQVVDWFVQEDRVAEWINVGQPEYVD